MDDDYAWLDSLPDPGEIDWHAASDEELIRLMNIIGSLSARRSGMPDPVRNELVRILAKIKRRAELGGPVPRDQLPLKPKPRPAPPVPKLEARPRPVPTPPPLPDNVVPFERPPGAYEAWLARGGSGGPVSPLAWRSKRGQANENASRGTGGRDVLNMNNERRPT